MKVDFATVDVFTDRRFGGNPLAVIPDARGLSSEQMQSIAAEFNLAETTFVLPPRDPAHTAQVRIFTPKAEIPFAGHPNVGTAFVLARAGESHGRKTAGNKLVFEEKAGLVPLDLERQGNEVVGARLAAPQKLALGDEVSPDIVAALAGVPVQQIETRNHRPIIGSCGIGFVFAELKTREALAKAVYNADAFAKHLPMDKATGVHLYAAAAEHGVEIQSRMFAPLYGVPEDPATGSANVALIGLLAKLQPEADLTLAKTIGQGFDMGRPSRLDATAEKKAGEVTATYIGGRCVPMLKGTIDLS
jgi:trans-2,3-dihydro-3-hydroxyanthranilate isomerase